MNQGATRLGRRFRTQRFAPRAVARIPEKTATFTVHVEPKRRESTVTPRVSRRRKAPPMKKRGASKPERRVVAPKTRVTATVAVAMTPRRRSR